MKRGIEKMVETIATRPFNHSHTHVLNRRRPCTILGLAKNDEGIVVLLMQGVDLNPRRRRSQNRLEIEAAVSNVVSRFSPLHNAALIAEFAQEPLPPQSGGATTD